MTKHDWYHVGSPPWISLWFFVFSASLSKWNWRIKSIPDIFGGEMMGKVFFFIKNDAISRSMLGIFGGKMNGDDGNINSIQTTTKLNGKKREWKFHCQLSPLSTFRRSLGTHPPEAQGLPEAKDIWGVNWLVCHLELIMSSCFEESRESGLIMMIIIIILIILIILISRYWLYVIMIEQWHNIYHSNIVLSTSSNLWILFHQPASRLDRAHRQFYLKVIDWGSFTIAVRRVPNSIHSYHSKSAYP